MVKYSVKAPAKINLTLDVLHKRDDGFHEVKMVMTQVDLADRLDFEHRSDGKIVVEISGGSLPLDERNLAYQAALLLQKETGTTQGASIYIHKHIPVAAGLAGGSSDAAATLKGLNQLWELSLSKERLAHLGATLGSDVPFCVYGNTALATGRGEKIQPISSPPPCWVILAKPPISVSTKDIYRRIQSFHPAEATEKMIQAITARDYNKMCATLYNALEEVTLSLHPEVRRIKERMISSGVDAALMSGSGPTVFGLVQKESRVRRVYNALRGFCDQVYAVRLITDKIKK